MWWRGRSALVVRLIDFVATVMAVLAHFGAVANADQAQTLDDSADAGVRRAGDRSPTPHPRRSPARNLKLNVHQDAQTPGRRGRR